MRSIIWTISILGICSLMCCKPSSDVDASILSIIEEEYGLSHFDTIYILPNSSKCIHCVRRFYAQLSAKVKARNNFFWVCPHPSEIDLSAFWQKKNVYLAYKEDICYDLDEKIQLLTIENGAIQSRFYGDISLNGELEWVEK